MFATTFARLIADGGFTGTVILEGFGVSLLECNAFHVKDITLDMKVYHDSIIEPRLEAPRGGR